jgi:hypothetical protein
MMVHKNNYYRKIVTFHGVLPSTHVYTVPPQLLMMASRRNRSSVQPNKQEPTEGHYGNEGSY